MIKENECKCGCEQLLTELTYIRDVEQPAAEAELQNSLWLLNELIDYLHVNVSIHHDVFTSEIFNLCEKIIRDRYTPPTREISDDDLPF